MNKYILKDGVPIRTDDLMEWAKNFENDDRRVAFTTVGKVDISTVFLGLDHNFMGGMPILFETMVFGGRFDQDQERYASLEESMMGHERMVAKVRQAYNPILLSFYDVLEWMKYKIGIDK